MTCFIFFRVHKNLCWQVIWTKWRVYFRAWWNMKVYIRDFISLMNAYKWLKLLWLLLCMHISFSLFSPLSGPCLPNPCHNGGICEISEAYRGDTFIGYVCKCPEGFNGIHCQHSKFHMVTFIIFIDRSLFIACSVEG